MLLLLLLLLLLLATGAVCLVERERLQNTAQLARNPALRKRLQGEK